MEKTKIAFLEIELWEEEYLRAQLEGFDLTFSAEALTPSTLKAIPNVEILSPFIYSTIDARVLNHLKSLRLIATRSTGFDHLDLAACQAKNILVANVPSYGENTVAEHTFALILALSRKIYPAVEKTRKGDFSLENVRGFDLKGKTLGVIGTGHIGRRVIQIAAGFEMKVLAYDLKADEKFAQAARCQYVPLDDLLASADIVTLHLPDNSATHHLINLKTLKLFKHGSYLINTARGGLCETTALLTGLKEGIFAGLGLDVLEEESFIKEERELLTPIFNKTRHLKAALENHILINQPQVLITPHNAFNSREALQRILDTTVANIKAFAGGRPVNLVSATA